MENQAAKRRISLIAGHFVPTDELSATHVFPMNCSSSSGLNSVIRRCDNRMYFARQGSSSQGCFMRPVSTEQASFPQPGMPLKYSGISNDSSKTSQTPLFSTPARVETKLPYSGSVQPLPQDCSKATEPAKFARPAQRVSRSKLQFRSKKKIHASEGIAWSPRMDVVESGRNYVVTVELPGVGTNDIRVEINGQNLTVMGNRSSQWWKLASYSNDLVSAYHKREILQGPYQVVWTLPANANKDKVSAQFVDGLLQITIPKL